MTQTKQQSINLPALENTLTILQNSVRAIDALSDNAEAFEQSQVFKNVKPPSLDSIVAQLDLYIFALQGLQITEQKINK